MNFDKSGLSSTTIFNAVQTSIPPIWVKSTPAHSLNAFRASKLGAFLPPRLGFLSLAFIPSRRKGAINTGGDYNLSDRLAGIKKAIADKSSQCTNLFSVVSTFAKKRHNPPIWYNGTGEDLIKMVAAGLNTPKEMPEPKPATFQVFDKGKEDRFYLAEFMRQFDAAHDDQVIIDAKTGLHQLLVSDLIFTDHKTNKSKIKKEGREQFILYIADAIKEPGEIRLESDNYGNQSLYFLSQFLRSRENYGQAGQGIKQTA